jgi:protein-disulfide isomerase
MKKSFLLLLLLLAMGLFGCLPKATPVPTATLAAPSTALPNAAPTTGLLVPNENALLPDSGCTVVTQKPTPGPTPETIYPPITADDHTKGPADAKVTIIEYSDFQ